MLQATWHQDNCAGAKWPTGLWMPPGTPFKERVSGVPSFIRGFSNFAGVTCKICKGKFPAGTNSKWLLGRERLEEQSWWHLFVWRSWFVSQLQSCAADKRHIHWLEEPITIFFVIISLTVNTTNSGQCRETVLSLCSVAFCPKRVTDKVFSLSFFLSYHALLTLTHERDTALCISQNSWLASMISGRWSDIFVWNSLYTKALTFRMLSLNAELVNRALNLSLNWTKQEWELCIFFNFKSGRPRISKQHKNVPNYVPTEEITMERFST